MFKEKHLSSKQRKYMKAKNIIGRALGGIGLVVLSPVYLAIIVAIKKEDGITAPVFFSQKRVGIHKTYFNLYKFRSMRTDTPHDKPTHLLENPDQYITKVGRFLRKSSLDELPQLWNIARGDMAVIGPRPALWNQDDLIAERDKYGANDVKPGLTGWAQINGRDELEIPVKARLDGEYVRRMGPLMDIRCFIGTVFSVLQSDGVVEGGTGAKKKNKSKRVLLVANVAKEHILKFHIPTIKMLKDKGWYVDVACAGNEEVPFCDHQYHMVYKRSPFSVGTIKGIVQMRKILKDGHYDILSCHTPTGGVVARIASIGLKNRPYVMYTAHGFHFYKGAPLINWLFLFPIEWVLGHVTDEIVVINQEDYANARRYHLGMKKITLLHGMGVDANKFNMKMNDEEKNILKKSLSIPLDEFVFIYVAEIIKNKNQQVLVDALKEIRKKNGRGVLLLVGPIHDHGELERYVKKTGMEKFVLFTGWRNDINKLYQIADVCTASSLREGLGLNLVEAQLSKVPVIASYNRGHCDIITNNKNGILVSGLDSKAYAQAMDKLMNDEIIREQIVDAACETCKKYLLENSNKQLMAIYQQVE